METITNYMYIYKHVRTEQPKRGHIAYVHTFVRMPAMRTEKRRKKKTDMNESETTIILNFRSHRWCHVCALEQATQMYILITNLCRALLFPHKTGLFAYEQISYSRSIAKISVRVCMCVCVYVCTLCQIENQVW